MKEYTVKVYNDGYKQWHLNGELHREDGPAIECPDGSKYWCLNGQLHREDGPAVENSNGVKEWWINGERHRENGPAIERPDGSKYWYINGKQLTEEEFNNRMKNFLVVNGKKIELSKETSNRLKQELSK